MAALVTNPFGDVVRVEVKPLNWSLMLTTGRVVRKISRIWRTYLGTLALLMLYTSKALN